MKVNISINFVSKVVTIAVVYAFIKTKTRNKTKANALNLCITKFVANVFWVANIKRSILRRIN